MFMESSSCLYLPASGNGTSHPGRLEPTGEPLRAQLNNGALVEIDPASQGARVALRDPQGRSLSLEISFSEDGPKVKVQATQLEAYGMERVRFDCQDFQVQASRSICLRSEHSYRCESKGRASHCARSVSVRATHGAIVAKANDEVQLMGDLILMNCDRPKLADSQAPVSQAYAQATDPARQQVVNRVGVRSGPELQAGSERVLKDLGL